MTNETFIAVCLLPHHVLRHHGSIFADMASPSRRFVHDWMPEVAERATVVPNAILSPRSTYSRRRPIGSSLA